MVELQRFIDVAHKDINLTVATLPTRFYVVLKYIVANTIGVRVAVGLTIKKLTILREPRSPARQPVMRPLRSRHENAEILSARSEVFTHPLQASAQLREAIIGPSRFKIGMRRA
ncbi:hypothetical protein CSW60_17290 [Caulobacter sp. X]|nr:hypothetical protein CSW60_17290 [Caulobacter sp. X]